MSYTLQYSKDLLKFLKKHGDISAKILEKLELIAKNPFDNPCNIVKLQGETDHYRLRLGKYRVLYQLRSGQILIIYAYHADSRGDVYK